MSGGFTHGQMEDWATIDKLKKRIAALEQALRNIRGLASKPVIDTGNVTGIYLIADGVLRRKK